MVLGGLFLPRATIESVGAEEVLLVVGRVVAYLAAADARLPSRALADGVPALLVEAAAAAYLVRLMHERVVEQSEAFLHQDTVLRDGRIGLVAGIDGDGPGNVRHDGIEVLEELFLEELRGEVLADLQLCAVDVVFGPMAEADLEEGQSRVVAVALGEVGVELEGEASELRVAPVGIVRRAVAAWVLRVGLVVVVAGLDVGRDSRCALVAIDVAARRVFVAEACDELMSATAHVVEDAFEPRPVVLDGAVVVASRHDLARQAIRELQLDGLAVSGVAVLSLFGPEHEARHGLRMGDAPLQLHRLPRLCATNHRRHHSDQQ